MDLAAHIQPAVEDVSLFRGSVGQWMAFIMEENNQLHRYLKNTGIKDACQLNDKESTSVNQTYPASVPNTEIEPDCRIISSNSLQQNEHRQNDNKRLCVHCSNLFQSGDEMYAHRCAKKSFIQCHYCDWRSDYLRSMHTHVTVHHPDSKQAIDLIKPKKLARRQKATRTPDIKSIIKCLLCGKTFPTMKRALGCAHNDWFDLPHKCPTRGCFFSCVEPATLELHTDHILNPISVKSSALDTI